MNTEEGQVSLFGQDGCAGRTCLVRSAAEHPRVKTSASSSRRSSELKAIPLMSLDLTPGHGNLLGESYWEMVSPWLGGSSILNTGPAPLSGEDVYSLSQILQDDPPRKYYLSRTACLGILRRARERGKELPPQLKAALLAQAGLSPLAAPPGDSIAFATNQRDEVRDLHDVAGALGAQPGMKQQTFITQDCLTPWDTQQARVFTPESKAPTLTGADGGGGRNPAGLLFTAGIVSKGSGNCSLMPECHTSLSSGGGQAGQGYPCILTGSLTPWDNQQRRISTPLGIAPTINSGEQKPGGLLFTAGFCAGAAPTAGGIGYQEEISPTLKAAESGTNMVPSILCLNDQGGSAIGCSKDMTGTLRAQEHGHQPLVMRVEYLREKERPVIQLYENHGIDARYTGPHPISPTLSARAGSGGNNLPLALQIQEPICIAGNTIDRQPQNGGNGLGCQEGIAYTLTATDHHAVYSHQRVDVFKDDNIASTESARQHKDATDLICQPEADSPLLIRRLTPLECERLQGFPDDWTDLPGASDSSRYKALGNSVAIPCVEHIMRGIVMALRKDELIGA